MNIENDYRGLEIAAGELLEEWLLHQQREQSRASIAAAKNREAAAKSFAAAKRGLPAGYYKRAVYLFELEDLADAGFQPRLACQILGLGAVHRARGEFEQKHPPCTHCGAPLTNAVAFSCWKCRKPIKRSA